MTVARINSIGAHMRRHLVGIAAFLAILGIVTVVPLSERLQRPAGADRPDRAALRLRPDLWAGVQLPLRRGRPHPPDVHADHSADHAAVRHQRATHRRSLHRHRQPAHHRHHRRTCHHNHHHNHHHHDAASLRRRRRGALPQQRPHLPPRPPAVPLWSAPRQRP